MIIQTGRFPTWVSATIAILALTYGVIMVFALHRHDEYWALVVGLAFAIRARLTIGRNRGTPMSQKDDPELVTSGPYRLVRHPIYSGVLVAGAATALALSWWWLVAVALAGIYFIYSATVEERFLTEQFPDTYAAYKRSTKMLVPFIL